MKKYLFTILSISFAGNIWAQNVGINPTGATPNASAGLDVDFTNMGILIPRVSLTQTSLAAPITTPATSLMVYNTATVNDVTPGYYYWNGTIWVRFITGSGTGAGWLTNGNTLTGTLPSSPNEFIGTTNAADWIVKTNNIEIMRVTSTGNVGIGTTSPQDALHIVSTIPTATTNLHPYRTGAIVEGDQNTFGGRLSIRQAGANGALTLFRTNGTIAAPTTMISGDVMGTISFGGYDGTLVNSFFGMNAIAAENWTNVAHGSDISFNTINIGAGFGGTEKMRITSEGNVGIGTSSPNAPLDVLDNIDNNGVSAIFVGRQLNGIDTRAYFIFQHQNIISGGDGNWWGLAVDPTTKDFAIHKSSFQDFIQLSNSTGNVLLVPTAGKVGIGTTTPAYKLHVLNTNPSVAINIYAPFVPTLTANQASNLHATWSEIITGSAFNFNCTLWGAVNRVTLSASQTGTVTAMVGATNDMSHNGTGTVGSAFGSMNHVSNVSSATITNAYGLNAEIFNTGGGTVTNGFGIYIGNIQATNKWSVYAIDATAPSYFAGKVGIGTLTPTASVDINAGTGYNQLRMRTPFTPANTADANGNTGDVAWDDNFVYVKTSAGWKRTTLSAF